LLCVCKAKCGGVALFVVEKPLLQRLLTVCWSVGSKTKDRTPPQRPVL
jgi:hypothetical protein